MNELYTKFESYIHKEMSAEELIVFEKELVNNPKLKEDFELHSSLQMVVDSQIEDESRQTIENLKNKPVQDAGLGDTGSPGSKKWMKFLAWGVLILGLIIGFNLGQKAKLDTEQLFLAYYSTPALDTERSGGNTRGATDFSANAHKLVGLGNFKGAQGKFRECGKATDDSGKACQWYEALCAFRLEGQGAKKMIENISNDKENPYKEKAKELLSRM